MPLSNTKTRYGSVTKTFHWLTALLIITLIALGLIAEDLPYETQAQLSQKAWLFSLHKTLGVTVFFVALLRIIWALSQPKPGLLNGNHKVESWLAKTVHWLLYGALVIVPLSGWIGHAAASGFAPIWWPFGQGLPLVPKSEAIEHAASTVHVFGGKVLIGTILLHFAGAMKHHVVDRDATLRRMLPGEPPVGPLPDQHDARSPVVFASVLWAATIGLGLAIGLNGDGEAEAAEAPALEQVASDWQVQDGTIAISVMQFGSEVEGSFADWTSAITFDETGVQGQVGKVKTTISIPSLTLGSVTQQAMGPDFFNASDYPTATFEADLMKASDDYVAKGTLTIKDQSVPVSLPFQLFVRDNTAEMRGDLTLDRRDFGIGATMDDAATLGFEVRITVALNATKAE